MAKTDTSNIHFYYLIKSFHFPRRTQIKIIIQDIFSSHKILVNEVNYIFCSAKYLRDINKTFLNHDYNTDVITFRLSDKQDPVFAEIFISIETVKDNAEQFNVSFLNELHRVIFHGSLHLCGYNDKTVAEVKEIRLQENKWIGKLVSRET